LYGLALGDAGVVTTLSATTPVLILPMLWISTGNRPPLMGWVGASVTLSGIVLITYSWDKCICESCFYLLFNSRAL